MIEDALFESAFKKVVFDKLKDVEQTFERRNYFINNYLEQNKESEKAALLKELLSKTSSLQKITNTDIYNIYSYYKIQNNIDSTLVNSISTPELDVIYSNIGKAKNEFNDAIYNFNIRTIGRKVKFFPAFEVHQQVAPTVKF